MALGSIPLWALTGLSSVHESRGRLTQNYMTGEGYVYATHNPGSLKYAANRWPEFVEDLRRAAQTYERDA